MKRILHSISIILLSIVYTLWSWVFSHTMAMEGTMQTTKECCNYADMSTSGHDMNTNEHKSVSSHCLSYEDWKITHIQYNHNYNPSNTIHHIPFVVVYLDSTLSETDYLQKQKEYNYFYDQKFLWFNDLIGVIVLLC